MFGMEVMASRALEAFVMEEQTLARLERDIVMDGFSVRFAYVCMAEGEEAIGLDLGWVLLSLAASKESFLFKCYWGCSTEKGELVVYDGRG